ncbi:MAG: hypothetical protein QOJ56_803 [Mycobacterium sp.]|nr:hypothetical protein [Mycobacterium sp.]
MPVCLASEKQTVCQTLCETTHSTTPSVARACGRGGSRRIRPNSGRAAKIKQRQLSRLSAAAVFTAAAPGFFMRHLGNRGVGIGKILGAWMGTQLVSVEAGSLDRRPKGCWYQRHMPCAHELV